MSKENDGLIVKAQSGFFTVHTDAGKDVVCQLPGRLKKEKQQTNIAAIGDRVKISLLPDGTGVIETVQPRKTVLARARPSAHHIRDLSADREQVLVANPDQVVLVFSIRQPKPNLRKVDRMLILAERHEVPAIICVSKIDLVKNDEAEKLFAPYEQLGYQLIYTSVKTGAGLDKLRDLLAGKLTALFGSSGVGKSSLLNSLQPGLGLKVGEVSRATTKGLHTTRYSELVAFEGGFVADTPGIRGVALYDIEATELDKYFREIAPLVVNCQFSDCTHQHEPSCAVQQAVADGTISAERYDSYLRLWQEQEALDRAVYGLA